MLHCWGGTGVSGVAVMVNVTDPEPVPEAGAKAKVTFGGGGLVLLSTVHVTPGAVVTLTVPDTFPPAQPPTDPSFITDGVTESIAAKVADTDWLSIIVTTQDPVPEQAPDHPENVEPVAGVSMSVTGVPAGKFAEQVVAQFIPVGEEVTVPVPVPALVSVSVNSAGAAGFRVRVAN